MAATSLIQYIGSILICQPKQKYIFWNFKYRCEKEIFSFIICFWQYYIPR